MQIRLATELFWLASTYCYVRLKKKFPLEYLELELFWVELLILCNILSKNFYLPDSKILLELEVVEELLVDVGLIFKS